MQARQTRMRANRFGIAVVFATIFFGMSFVSGCLPETPASEAPGAPASPSENLPNDAWYWIYFTNPLATNARSYRGGPDAQLAKAIEAARVSVDVAIYDLNLWSLRDALLKAHRSGLTVRVVTESDNLDEPEIQDLKKEGIPVLGDRREGLMHNKFVVIDRQEVWTGSMNFTTSDGYLNNNHLVRLQSADLALAYTVEFEEMFVSDLFGPDVRPNTPKPVLEINGARLEVLFSPDDGVQQRLIELIQQAQHSVYFLAFSFTSDPLAEALIIQSEAGVLVVGVLEEAQVISNIGSDYERFLAAGLDVRLDGNPNNMHHKILIIDERIVVLGSYNFSRSAEVSNDENTLILDDESFASPFVSEFQRIFDSAHR
jgi:phosphatidylserine/phosphatidylglycerophosphate/cardiolipin synthase-like enzyme